MAAKGIEKIKAEFAKLSLAEQHELVAELNQLMNTADNPITTLSQMVQQRYGGNITTEVWTEGVAHAPVVHCTFTLPNGVEYTASGKNQKIAKQLAAEKAIAALRQKQDPF